MAEALIQGRDYYVENGLWVFTADYLRRRGYCCQSGCRHCPYGFKQPSQSPAEDRGEEAR
jgi:hypothetical protein